MTLEEREIALTLVAEARELFDEVEPKLIALQQSSASAANPEIINSVFRSFHSVKGAAATMGFEQIARLTHSAESHLAVFRRGAVPLDPISLQLLLESVDLSRQLLTRIEEDTGGEDLEESIQALGEKLARAQNLAENNLALTKSVPKPEVESCEDTKNNKSVPATSEVAAQTVEPVTSSALRAQAQEIEISAPAQASLQEEQQQTAVNADTDADAQVGKEPALITQETNAHNGIAAAELGEPAAGSTIPGINVGDFANQFYQESEELLGKAEAALLSLETAPSNAATALADAFRAMHSFKGNCGFMGHIALEQLAHRAESLLELLRENPSARTSNSLSILLKTIDTLRNGVSELTRQGKLSASGFSGLEAQLGEAAGTIRGEDQHLAAKQSPPDTSTTKSANGAQSQRQDIRVDLQKLDTLINLVGELVIAEAMVTNHPAIAKAEDETLARAIHLLRRVSLDLQDVAMSVRMVPLSSAFRKLVRLVYDVSHKVGKKVRLELIGEETEVDKSVLEQLSDPLVHLVRNAIDHGLEPPDLRESVGKFEEGVITVEAKHEGGEVLVAVRDDGRGLNRNRILEKALERGLVHRDSVAKMTDEQIYAFIFEAGFSTAEKVTDVSGRGVGMDVVRKNIERLQGTVELRSREGTGTAVILHIPLTLAIIEGMLVRVGSARYTVPLLSIRESLRPEARQIIKSPDGQEVARVRDRLFPVLRLHEVFSRKPDHGGLHEGILVIVEANGHTAALFADEILGQQQAVIKGLSSYLGRARGVSGCTILGDGEVSLILDIAALLGLANDRAAA